jgi:hypothetical protein
VSSPKRRPITVSEPCRTPTNLTTCPSPLVP